MAEEQQFSKSALDKFRQWHFWWLVVFSFLLIMTFVYYLPTRFLNQSMNMTMAPMPSITPIHSGMVMQSVTPTPDLTSLPKASVSVSPASQPSTTPTPVQSVAPSVSNLPPGSMVMPDGSIMMMAGSTMYQEENDVKQGLVVNLNVNPVPYKIGVPLSLDFFVNQKPGNVPVLVSELDLNHTKYMHVVGVRSDMSEFFHIHPEFLADNPSIFTIDHVFTKPGKYKIWSDIAKNNVGYVFGHPEIVVQGDGPTEDKQVDLTRARYVGNYEVVMITDRTVAQKRNTPISFEIRTLTGQSVEVESFIGSPMHLNIIKDDWKQFIHTHPGMPPAPLTILDKLINTAYAHDASMHSIAPGATIDFNVAFPEPGLYKAFAQFRPKGINLPPDEALVADFWIDVKEKAPSFISQWWALLLISVLLMAGLSWWVNNYLKVKPEDVTVAKK